LLLLENGLSLALDLVVVSLDDWAGNGADVLLLGDILRFCGILAVVVKPVLRAC
jgi:hypothetical protein